ncbi:MAG: DNA polymerase I [Candidatus Magasanikbacteria bacterium]|nr:DNA polymerase I [Candidatus Magasanikbacteria bacterium]
MPRFIIIDGNAIVHRAFHAIPPLLNKKGLILNAVYGFTSILLRAIKELKPDYAAVAFDLKAPTFRHKEYKDYKAKRIKQPQELYDQMVLVKDLLRAMQIPIFEKEGFEADDIIATLAVKNKGENLIVTGDMDTLQLVNDKTKIYTMKKGVNDIVVYDAAAVQERYGLKPEQMIDYKALRGDPSDNILGVKGIGEKTAGELIKKFGSLEKIYEKIDKLKDLGISPSIIDKLKTGKKDALFSKRLVTLIKDAPIDFKLEDCELKDYNNPVMRELLAEWEFGSLLKRLDGVNGGSEGVKKKPDEKKQKIIEIKKATELAELNKKIKKVGKAAIYLSDDGQAGLKAKLFGVFLTGDGEKIYHVPVNFACDLILPTQIIGHDLKRNSEILKRYDIELSGQLRDVMVMDYLLDPGMRSHDLRALALRYLAQELPDGEQTSLFGADLKILGQKAVCLWQIGEKLETELTDKGLINLYEKIEAPLILVLARMEEAGIKVDVEHLKKLSQKLSKTEQTVSKKIFELAGQEFNIASPQQLKEILFDKLKIPVMGIRKGKTGLSTAASELEKMRGLHPIIDLISEYREIAKLQNTYVDVLPNLLDEKTQRVHTTFNQAITATGRLSSSEPNIQNIPIRGDLGKEIRQCFVADKGFKLVSADYSQIELRVVASLANDKEMVEIFKKGEDIHKMTAAKINGVEPEQVTPEMRQAAKAINFGIIYGMGPHSLAESTGVSFVEAKDFIAKYFEIFKDVKKFLDETKALAHSLGYVETLLGRRRYLPEINSGIPMLRSSAERMAINAPVQGTSADLIKTAMIEVDKLLAEKYDDSARLLLQVHDELVLEVKDELVEQVSVEVKEIMENVIKLRVPVRVDTEIGESWGKE